MTTTETKIVTDLIDELYKFGMALPVVIQCDDCRDIDPIKAIKEIKLDGDNVVIVVSE